MSAAVGTVFLFDVDNTLLDNDRIQADLRERLEAAHGDRTAVRYWEIFQEQWGAVGYADYFGALARLNSKIATIGSFPVTANWLMDYPFADRLYPGALDAVEHVRQWGYAVILSDGDAVLQPRKIARSGLWKALAGDVLIYVHKEKELKDVERCYLAARYVLIDDNPHLPRRREGILGRSSDHHLSQAGSLRASGAAARGRVSRRDDREDRRFAGP